MVDPGDAGAAVEVVALEQALGMLHLVEELEREAVRIVDAERRPLPELDIVGPGDRAAERLVPAGDLVEVRGMPDPERDVVDERLRSRAQHEAVVQPLLDAAQVERVAGVRGGEEAEHVDVESPRGVRGRSTTSST